MNREQWSDIARGLGIILVVYGHVMRGLGSAGVTNAPWVQVADFTIYLFHMPLFFFLSGLHIDRSLAKGGFLAGRLWSVAYPYLLWSLVQGGLQVAAGGATNAETSASDLLQIGWKPIGQFWFLYALFICQIAAFLLPRKTGARLAVAIGVYGISLFLSDSLYRSTAHGFLFFTAGLLLAPYLGRIAATWTLSGVTWLVFSLAAGALIWSGISDQRSLTALPAAAVGVAGVVLLSKQLRSEWLASLGRMSMTVFVLHVLFGAAARIAMQRLGVPNDVALYAAVGVLAGVGGPVAAHLAMQRLGLLPLFGLAPPPAVRRTAPA